MQSVPVPDTLSAAFAEIGLSAMNARKREVFGLASAGRDDAELKDYLVRFKLPDDLADWLVALVRQYGTDFEFDVVRDETPPMLTPPAVAAPPMAATGPAYEVPTYDDKRSSRATRLKATWSALVIVAVIGARGYMRSKNAENQAINRDITAIESSISAGTVGSMPEVETEFGKDFQSAMVQAQAVSKRFSEEMEKFSIDDLFDAKRLSTLKGVEKSRSEALRSKEVMAQTTKESGAIWTSLKNKHGGILGDAKKQIDRAIQEDLDTQRHWNEMLDAALAYLDYAKANDPGWNPKGKLDPTQVEKLLDKFLTAQENLAKFLNDEEVPGGVNAN